MSLWKRSRHHLMNHRRRGRGLCVGPARTGRRLSVGPTESPYDNNRRSTHRGLAGHPRRRMAKQQQMHRRTMRLPMPGCPRNQGALARSIQEEHPSSRTRSENDAWGGVAAALHQAPVTQRSNTKVRSCGARPTPSQEPAKDTADASEDDVFTESRPRGKRSRPDVTGMSSVGEHSRIRGSQPTAPRTSDSDRGISMLSRAQQVSFSSSSC